MPAESGSASGADADARAAPVRRLAGIDVARGLAVLGMYAAHVGPSPAEGGLGPLFRPFEGRSTALFAVLAGVSIALMSGGRTPRTGTARTKVGVRLGTRAPLLLALGLWLTELETAYLVILAYYGVCFVLAIPCLRLGARALTALAIGSAVLVPLVSMALRAFVAPRDLVALLPDVTMESLTVDGPWPALLALVLTGTFPALGLMTYLFAGMAIGRLDLGSDVVCARLLGGGTALAVLSYGTSWAAMDVLGGRQAVEDALAPAATSAGVTSAEFFETHINNIHGTPPTTSPAWLLVSTAHSYTPFDLLACLGIAAAVIGASLLLARRIGRALRPLADLGSVILSAYVAHFVAIRLIWPAGTSFSLLHFLEFAVVAMAAAVAWRYWIGRGPLEWALHVVSTWPTRLVDLRARRSRSPRARSAR